MKYLIGKVGESGLIQNSSTNAVFRKAEIHGM